MSSPGIGAVPMGLPAGTWPKSGIASATVASAHRYTSILPRDFNVPALLAPSSNPDSGSSNLSDFSMPEGDLETIVHAIRGSPYGANDETATILQEQNLTQPMTTTIPLRPIVPVVPITYQTENDISANRRQELVNLMNQRLASAVDLQLQLKQAHWNVKGPHFIALHELFDKASEGVESYVDTIAERIVQLGGVAAGTARTAASRSRLQEYPLDIANGSAHVEAVSKALSDFGRDARQTILEATELDDADSADIFTEVSRGVDKWLWFVEAHSQAEK